MVWNHHMYVANFVDVNVKMSNNIMREQPLIAKKVFQLRRFHDCFQQCVSSQYSLQQNRSSFILAVCVLFKEADVETKGLKKILCSGKKTPPRIITIMANSAETPTTPSTDGPTSNFIVFDGCVVDVGTACTKQAILTLISTYYVFSLEYPKIYSQVLGLAQTFVVCDSPYSGEKSTGYTKIANKMFKNM